LYVAEHTGHASLCHILCVIIAGCMTVLHYWLRDTHMGCYNIQIVIGVEVIIKIFFKVRKILPEVEDRGQYFTN